MSHGVMIPLVLVAISLHDWQARTLAAIEAYISRPGMESLAREVRRSYFDNRVWVGPARGNERLVETIKHVSEDKEKLAEINWQEAMIGALEGDVGGGGYICVVFGEDKKPVAIVVVPGQ